ncbi:MAG TPA: hypothetical protein VFA26_19795 [Gemmataceae bacterium]|nr:hypothetical protein [Gemmataceae bacterium]
MLARPWTWAAAGALVAAAAGPAAAQQAARPGDALAMPDTLPAAHSPYRPHPAGGPAGAGETLPTPRVAGPAPDAAPAPTDGTRAVGSGPLLNRRDQHRLKVQECYLGFRSEFVAPPLGYWVYQNYRTMVGNGIAAQMVLYQYDFLPGSPQLNVRGQDHLARIASVLPKVPYAVVIERTPCDPALAEARRMAVLTCLAQGPAPVPPDRVVIGPALANGLNGPEAERVYQNLLIQTATGGIQAGLGSGPPGTTTAPTAGSTGRSLPTPTIP